jgi:hypothetical protein
MSERPPTKEHIVLLVHGIRTTAKWVGMVKETLERTSSNALTVEPVSYGMFSLWRFILPGLSRRAPVAAISRYIRAVRARDNDLNKDPNDRRLISVVAHSFGTYCLFKVLDQNPNVRLHRVILCGSVLPQNMGIDRYQGQLGPSKVLNECGDRDPWPVIAKKIAWGCGSAGTFGLLNERAINRFHRNGHSDYFDAGFIHDMWEPFLQRGEVQTSAWDKFRDDYPNPWWIRALDRFPALAFLLVLVIIGSLFFFAPELNCRLSTNGCPVATSDATPPLRAEPVAFTAESNWTQQGSDSGTFCNDEFRKKSQDHPDLKIVMKDAIRHQRRNGPIPEVQYSCSFEGTPKGTSPRAAPVPMRPAEERIYGDPKGSHAGDGPADGDDVTSCANADVANGWHLQAGSGKPETVEIANGVLGLIGETYKGNSYCITFHITRSNRGGSAGVTARASAVQEKMVPAQ